jgi:aspartyl/asparaginyl beta-hydroxylase (cupin superfamily)
MRQVPIQVRESALKWHESALKWHESALKWHESALKWHESACTEVALVVKEDDISRLGVFKHLHPRSLREILLTHANKMIFQTVWWW